MNDHIDQLNETFAAHEHLAPDAEDVLARAHRIARSYHRRRWAVRATGGAVLGAGLVAGSIALPGLGHSSTQSLSPATDADGGSPSPSPTTTYTQSQEFDAYFAAGYDLHNAQELATIWNDSDLTQVKADAGLKLLEGGTLPVTADNPPLSQSQPDITDVDAFFSAGYDYQDAVTLAGMWNEKESYSAKIKGGKLLLAGQTLPIPPSGPPTAAGTAIVGRSTASKFALGHLTNAQRAKLAKAGKIVVVPKSSSGSTSDSGSEATAAAMAAYFAAGYDYQDAVALGQVWNETDINQIKAEAGQKLIAGDTLPVPPSGTPETPTDAAVSAFFAAGYTYQDAVTLGNMWNDSNTYQVKIDAGNKLLDGQTLPIGP
jgi:hypothetical protein